MSMHYHTTARIFVGCLIALFAASAIAQEQDDDRDRSQRSETRESRDDNDRDRDERFRDRDSRDRQYDRNRSDDERNRETFDRNRRQRDDEPAGLGVTITEDRNGRVRVDRIFRGSPAAEAGIRSNDEILQIDGQRIDSTQELISLIRRKEPGTQARIQIDRNGERRTLVAQLEPRREALNTRPDRYGQPYDGGWSEAPRGHNDLMQYIGSLQRDIERLSRELSELHAMLDDDPSRRDWSDSTTSYSREDRSDRNRSIENRERDRSDER